MRSPAPRPAPRATLASLRIFAAAPLALFLAACPGFHQSPGVRLQEAATELNVNTRFGRMEMATESVAPTARDAFMQRRRAWGNDVRVADYELAGVHVKESETEAETFVQVAWYRIDQGDLHNTTLKQSWRSFKGDWKLVDETRKEGDAGLLNEPGTTPDAHTSAPPMAVRPAAAQFPTIKLGEKPEPVSE